MQRADEAAIRTRAPEGGAPRTGRLARLAARRIRGSWAVTRTTAFRQAALYVGATLAVGAAVLWLLYLHTTDLVTRQLVETLSVEAEGLAELGRVGGQQTMVEVVTARSATSGVSGRLYLLVGAGGARLAGNLREWPAEIGPGAAGSTFSYPASAQGSPLRLAAGVARRLPGELRLLVARDLEEQRRLSVRVMWLFIGGFGVLGLAGIGAGIVAGRLTLSRLARVTRTSDAIMRGDFTGRIVLTGPEDELEQLARNLNAMLDRIEQLMAGLREVSDNIAHDLKTPLNRLRSRAEAALREASEPEAAREALGRVIEDADELIKTFNALLLIARLEAGAVQDTAEVFDIGVLARDMAELYEPVAEEAGLAIQCRAGEGFELTANRQLVGQAIANLIDNAIKYGRPVAGAPALVEIEIKRGDAEVAISVADHGAGIPAVDRERVLKRFVRLEASRSRPGTGLGLSLVAAVARLQGGRVLLEDNAPGLRIVLMLPVRAS